VNALTQDPPAPNFEGQTINLAVTAFGPGTLGYQWRKGGSPLTGSTSATLSLTKVLAADSGNYDVVISNGNGSVTSSVVVLTVAAVPPQILHQPVSATRYVGGSATFTVDAGGSSPITYKWSFGGNPIPGATSASYTVSNVGPSTVGNYSVLL